MTAPKVKLGAVRLGIDNAFARMPFRFGVVTMDAAASLTLELEMTVDGKRSVGYASDLLAYKWFDKRPEKTPADNVADLLWVVHLAASMAKDLPADTPFELWKQLDLAVDRAAVAGGFNRLGASFGVSMIERAMIDGVGKALGLSFRAMLTNDALGLRPADIFPELDGMSLEDAIPSHPLTRLSLRHTIGMVDPLTAADPFEPVNDGLPETLEDYLREDGIRYLKIKLAGDLLADIERLRAIAGVLAAGDYRIAATLDGNEQYKHLDDFAALMESIRSNPALASLFAATLFVEQPLERSVALASPLDAKALDAIGLPLLIDEADGWTRAYREAIDLGYRGVSHKNCKGVIRSLLNAMLATHYSHLAGRPGAYFQSAEDLTCLPAVSLQADLTVVSAFGIGHVERNGHHYFRGLDHLPVAEAEAALAIHPDLYERKDGRVLLAIHDGALRIGSLETPGLGSSVTPNLKERIDPASWSFEMLNRTNHA
ncbi:mandelate racemase [Agrobacterium genomosp. 3]|uniref:mandelate racemase n=1 Tax=Agrobacterium tomkonis TaxID=1183410 RepID=UPI001CD8F607|nr:mandelate racemase [Agrobacterium tomkonis]MCA1879270.1 mandelate racemase [Agrobacterium tumefaciens]MCA1894433.1 mandelate racemase [Agrobacterium tomkonis]